jgi:hypothetical protein
MVHDQTGELTMEIIKRAGFTTNHTDFRQAHIPFWPSEYEKASPTSWIGRATADTRTAQNINQHYHNQSEKFRGLPPGTMPADIADIDARRRFYAANKKTATDLARRNIDRMDEINAARAKLTIPHDPAEFGLRKERREYLQSLADEKARIRLTETRESFRLAAAEQDPELSGLPASYHTQMVDQTLRSFFPKDVADLDEAANAEKIQAERLKSTFAAIDAEYNALGGAPSTTVEGTKKAVGWA